MGGKIQPGTPLTAKQREVLNGVAAGKYLKAIAAEQGVKTSTVASVCTRLRKKMGVRTNRELIALCAVPQDIGSEIARLRAEVASLEAWRTTMNREINLVCAQRDALRRTLAELQEKQDARPTQGYDPAEWDDPRKAAGAK